MTNMKTLIEREFDAFFEFETDNRDVVTSTSAKLFAEHVVGIATAPESPAVRGEPVAWMTTARVLGEGITTDKRHGEKWMKSHPSKTTPLYAAPLRSRSLTGRR